MTNLVTARLIIIVFSCLFLALERTTLIEDLSVWPHTIALFGVVHLMRLEYRNCPAHTLAIFYQSFYFTGMLLSAVLITAGLPMIEIGEVGTANGTFWALVIFLVCGTAASSMGFRVKLPLDSGRRRLGAILERRFVIGLTVAVVATSILVLLLFSNPYSLGMDRVVYWDTVVPGHLSWVNSAVRQTVLFPILLFYMSESGSSQRRLASGLIAAYLVITVVMLGEKASAFILYSAIWLLVLGAYRGRFGFDRRMLILLVGGLGSIYALLSYNYGVAEYGDAFIITRIAMQAQVLWSVLNSFDFPFFSQVASECFWGCDAASGPADYVSLRYLPSYLYAIYSESGSTLSGFLPGLAILSFGFFGALILHILVSFVLGFIASRLLDQFRRHNLLYSFLLFKVYFAMILYWYAAIHTAVHSLIFFLTIALVVVIFVVGGNRKRRISSPHQA